MEEPDGQARATPTDVNINTPASTTVIDNRSNLISHNFIMILSLSLGLEPISFKHQLMYSIEIEQNCQQENWKFFQAVNAGKFSFIHPYRWYFAQK
ncbi:MAG: hypothetical protein ACREDS_16855 [Limisphaerales bacterium]